MRKIKDHFYYKAKKEKYPARSVYKLKEIDAKYNLIKNGYKTLDLGASPGSWSKYCSRRVGEKGLVLGVDKEGLKTDLSRTTESHGHKPVDECINKLKVVPQSHGCESVVRGLPNNVRFIQADIFKIDIGEIKKISPEFDVVLSDLAPSTTGTKEVDQARSMELAKEAFNIAKQVLKKNGHFICKIFQGPDTKSFIEEIRPLFKEIKILKPSSSRKESFEIYIVALFKTHLKNATIFSSLLPCLLLNTRLVPLGLHLQ